MSDLFSAAQAGDDFHTRGRCAFLTACLKKPHKNCVRHTVILIIVSQMIVIVVFACYIWNSQHMTAKEFDRTKASAANESTQWQQQQDGNKPVRNNHSVAVTNKLQKLNTTYHPPVDHQNAQQATTSTKRKSYPFKTPKLVKSTGTSTTLPTLHERSRTIHKLYKKASTKLSKISSTIKKKSPEKRKDTSQPTLSCNTYNPEHSYHTELFCLTEDRSNYTVKFSPSVECLIEGTDLVATTRKKRFCVCKTGWSGMYCSKPMVVTKSDLPNYYGIELKARPRRIIYALPFSMELDMLEARLAMLHDVVDVFVILESNYTASGLPKPWLLRQKLDTGWMKQHHAKILYMALDYFPEEAKRDGWVIDALLRNYISTRLMSSVLQHYRYDDIFILTDADELPMRETLLFLKLHHGYPEPFGVRYTHNVFGFFWKEGITESYFGCTIAMLHYVFQNKAYSIRSAPTVMQKNEFALNVHIKTGARVRPWMFGTEERPAGWHCSWCFTPQGVKVKLDWSQLSDLPRWGDYPEKKDVTYIENLIKSGTWFDDMTKFRQTYTTLDLVVPSYFVDNEERFSYLINV